DLHAHSGVTVARVPPVMPHTGFYHGRLALAKDGRLPGALHGQLALKHSDTLDKSGMAVFADNLRSDERGKLCRRATFGVLVGKLEDRRAFACDGVFPDLTDLDRRAVRWSVRVRVRHK